MEPMEKKGLPIKLCEKADDSTVISPDAGLIFRENLDEYVRALGPLSEVRIFKPCL